MERGTLAPEQVEVLLRPIRSNRVLLAQGQSHVPAYDVVAHLTRVFGFEGWDKQIVSIDLVAEDAIEKGGRVGYTVTYRCLMRLSVYDRAGQLVKVVEDGACGSANNLPSRGDAHDFAYKNAISYAIKRCAKDLGDQFGLSLYNKGSQKALVVKIVQTSDEDIESHIEEPTGLGNDELDLDVGMQQDQSDVEMRRAAG